MLNVLNTLKRPSFIKIKELLIRTLELVVLGLSLPLLVPIFLIIGLLVKFTSAGPVFYTVERIGKDGRLFRLYKFRDMYLDLDQQGRAFTVQNDPHVTPWGRVLHSTKLGKLAQLLNVFRGEMSLVGPQPQDPCNVAQNTPGQRQVLAVRPGIISPASFHYRQEETLASEDDRETVHRSQILLHKLTWLAFRLHNRHFFLLDILALCLIPMLALMLRLERLDWWSEMGPPLVVFILVVLLVKLPIFYKLGLYNRYWRYAGSNDLVQVTIAVSLSTTVLTVLFAGAHSNLEQYDLAMYRVVPLIDGLLTLVTIGGMRFGLRGLYHWHRQSQAMTAGQRVLVVGAGETGKMVVSEMRANPELNMEPVAFIDDDLAKVNIQIEGLSVIGTTEDIPRLVDRYQIQQIIVAIPSAPLGRQKDIINRCKQTGIITHSLPGVYEILAGYKTISHLPDINVNRLLHRQPVTIEQEKVIAALKGATVLVTGAGGSIGSELCRQIARCNPAEVILLGHGENSIFEISLNLQLTFPDLVTHPVIVDVRDQQGVNRAVEKYRPKVILHAAAHKHVPFMEDNVYEALTNNVLGTQNVLQAAEQYGVERFVLISTDKAVNPTSVMGATKRLAELLVVATASRSSRAYMAVRFGNVLGSRGSVIPIFQRQIAAGGPLTLTHPDMRRYFMTIPEAVQLVLQASVLGKGGEVFVLDMGQPVWIRDLATELIKLSGLELGRDIEIVYTGMRPGEKLSEELFLPTEDYRRPQYKKIFVTRCEDAPAVEVLQQVVLELINLTRRVQSQNDIEQVQALLLRVCYYIDQYQPQPRSSLPRPTVTPAASLPTPSHRGLSWAQR